MHEKINIKILFEGSTYPIETFHYEYRSLMALIYDKLLVDEEFGECKGMGRCGTCIIKIIDANPELESLKRNESSTLEKMDMLMEHIHLSCQIEITSKIDGAIIEIIGP